MTCLEPRFASVNCFLCHRAFQISVDVLRDLIDRGEPNDGQPHCGCKPRPKSRTPVPEGMRTKADMCLLVIAELEAHYAAAKMPTEAPVSAIVVRVWERHPVAFGLPGFPDLYPDSNRVIMELVKMKSRGLIHNPREKHYTVAPDGTARLAQLRAKK